MSEDIDGGVSVQLRRAISNVRRAVRLGRLPTIIGGIRTAVRRRRTGVVAPVEHGRLREAIASVRRAVTTSRATGRVPRAAAAIRDALGRDAAREMPSWIAFAHAYRCGGLPVAALSVCGRGTAEIRFTQLLRFYLDPAQPHGLGPRCAHAVFPELAPHALFAVEAEVDLGTDGTDSRRNQLDLLLRAPDRVVLVEQKILSAESVEEMSSGKRTQLERYGLAFHRRWPGLAGCTTMYFLTPDGRQPAAAASAWTALSHTTVVQRLAQILTADPTLSATARANLLALAWDLLLGPLAAADALAAVARDAGVLSGGEPDGVRFAAFHREVRHRLPLVPIDLFLTLVEALP